MKDKNSGMMPLLLNSVFVLLFLTVIGLLGWLSERYQTTFDVSWGQRNSLTATSVRLVERLDQPLSITAFVRDSSKATRDNITDLVERFRRHKSDIELKFVNPDLAPQLVREQGITVDGEVLIHYANRKEKLKAISEQSLTALLTRISKKADDFIVFLTGHGERDPLGRANHDFGEFGRQLVSLGFNFQSINLAKSLSIPDNTSVLVIASPQTAYLPGEIELLEKYIARGGRLIWFTEPDDKDNLQQLAARFDLQRLPGVVVDATTQLFGIADPSFALALEYPQHPITTQLHSQTLFPRAVGLQTSERSDWNITPFISTLQRSWTEVGEISDAIRFDADSEERPGPITIGLAYTRMTTPGIGDDSGETANSQNDGTEKQQRAVIMGDGDFLSNQYLGNGQNLDLGIALFRWLSHDEQLIDIGSVQAPDLRLDVSQAGAIALLLVFLVLLPLGLLITGITIWLKRRNS